MSLKEQHEARSTMLGSRERPQEHELTCMICGYVAYFEDCFLLILVEQECLGINVQFERHKLTV